MLEQPPCRPVAQESGSASSVNQVAEFVRTDSLINYASALATGVVNMEYNVEVPYVQVVDAKQTTTVPGGEDKAKVFAKNYPCTEVGNIPENAKDAYNSFVVRGDVFKALGYKVNEKLGQYDVPEFVRANTNIYVTTPPAHGTIVQVNESAKKAGVYSYKGDGSYIGKDTFVISVDTFSKKGKKVTFNLKYNVSVVESITNEQYPSTCVGMKFSSLSNSPVTFAWNSPNPVSFANLGASSIGETLGNGLTAQITLDTNAAGHGWFIDATPEGNRTNKTPI